MYIRTYLGISRSSGGLKIYLQLLAFLLEIRKKVEHLENLIGSKDATNCHGGA